MLPTDAMLTITMCDHAREWRHVIWSPVLLDDVTLCWGLWVWRQWVTSRSWAYFTWLMHHVICYLWPCCTSLNVVTCMVMIELASGKTSCKDELRQSDYGKLISWTSKAWKFSQPFSVIFHWIGTRDYCHRSNKLGYMAWFEVHFFMGVFP